MSLEEYCYIKDDKIYLHIDSIFLNNNELAEICEYIYNNYFLLNNTIKIELYLDNIKIIYFVKNLNTIMKYGKIIKENFTDKEVFCNIYNHSQNKSISFFAKIINEIDNRALSRIKIHELPKSETKKILSYKKKNEEKKN
jgi:hypothetical protein